MTVEEVFNNDAIQFILLQPGLKNDDGVTILKKSAYKPETLEGYTFKGMYNNKEDMVEFTRKV